ncbi:Clp protease N-terminal domain-containing protein [Allorhizocola rhizosphaerae]|uniref:Clp protease N-terminal domain-containing protein n=1 Tax=Allorhizocola rhizosphaerae TaxID=1872709 RepID=UPI0013C35FBB|nr:Clp protease N-terminal domain-containing protein [Allorhizocola rhizosphaerae]
MPMFGQAARDLVDKAYATAKTAGAGSVEIEHLLIAIMDTDPSGDAAVCLADAG